MTRKNLLMVLFIISVVVLAVGVVAMAAGALPTNTETVCQTNESLAVRWHMGVILAAMAYVGGYTFWWLDRGV